MDMKCVEYFASTEVYRGGQWVTVEPLPAAVTDHHHTAPLCMAQHWTLATAWLHTVLMLG